MSSTLSKLWLASCGLSLALLVSIGQAQETLRKEVAQALEAAKTLITQGKSEEALAPLSELSSQAKDGREMYWIESVRAQAAERAGDFALASSAYKTALEKGQINKQEKMQLLGAAVPTAMRARDFSSAASWAELWRKEQDGAGEAARTMRQMEVRALFQSNQPAKVPDIVAIEPVLTDEPSMSILAASYVKLGNEAGYVAALEGLLLYHPKPAYWVDRLSRLQDQPGFSKALGLELYRLQLAVGAITTGPEYLEMAQLSLKATYPAEAQSALNQGVKAGLLKESDATVASLLEKAKTQVAEDKASLERTAQQAKSVAALTRNGWALASSGRVDAGGDLLERAAAEQATSAFEASIARLRLGQTLVMAGQADKASEVLRRVVGSDGASDLARLWRIFLKRP